MKWAGLGFGPMQDWLKVSVTKYKPQPIGKKPWTHLIQELLKL